MNNGRILRAESARLRELGNQPEFLAIGEIPQGRQLNRTPPPEEPQEGIINPQQQQLEPEVIPEDQVNIIQNQQQPPLEIYQVEIAGIPNGVSRGIIGEAIIPPEPIRN